MQRRRQQEDPGEQRQHEYRLVSVTHLMLFPTVEARSVLRFWYTKVG